MVVTYFIFIYTFENSILYPFKMQVPEPDLGPTELE